jgi:hypothetical protein
MISQVSANINFSNMDFSFCPGAHCFCDTGSMSCYGNYTISSNCAYHIATQYSTFILTPSGYNTVTIAAGVQVGSAFVFSTGVGFVRCNTRTNFVGAVSGGNKFNVTANAVIDTSGAGVNFFPGTIAGTSSMGGVYV